MRAILGAAAASAFVGLVVCCVWKALLLFYLDMRRSTLIGTGQLPKSTPKFFVEPSTMHKAFFGFIDLNRPYIFSRTLDESPDRATRWWAPVLRKSVMTGRILGVATVVLVALYVASDWL